MNNRKGIVNILLRIFLWILIDHSNQTDFQRILFKGHQDPQFFKGTNFKDTNSDTIVNFSSIIYKRTSKA